MHLSLTKSGNIEGIVTPLEEDLVVQAKLLRIILRSFASKSSVRLTVSDTGLGILNAVS